MLKNAILNEVELCRRAKYRPKASGKTSSYIFNSKHIQIESAKLKKHLQERHFAPHTVTQYTNYARYFLNWLESKRLEPGNTTYNHILEFIEYCREDKRNSRLINRMLSAVRHYYGYLNQTKNVHNPAAGVYIKGIPQTVPGNLVKMEELEELYRGYKAIDNRTKRNKIILGILIYQYPTVDELKKLQVSDINLNEGVIYIPASRKSNQRVLSLKPFQVIDLQHYLNEIRPKLLKPVPIESSGQPTEQLFLSINGNKNIKNSILHMFNAIKKINPAIKSAMQIRMSAISHLQKSIPLRKLQYMAGHKYISSTERYKTNNTDELHKQLEMLHPLNSF